jgi:hypothetical protein
VTGGEDIFRARKAMSEQRVHADTSRRQVQTRCQLMTETAGEIHANRTRAHDYLSWPILGRVQWIGIALPSLELAAATFAAVQFATIGTLLNLSTDNMGTSSGVSIEVAACIRCPPNCRWTVASSP